METRNKGHAPAPIEECEVCSIGSSIKSVFDVDSDDDIALTQELGTCMRADMPMPEPARPPGTDAVLAAAAELAPVRPKDQWALNKKPSAKAKAKALPAKAKPLKLSMALRKRALLGLMKKPAAAPAAPASSPRTAVEVEHPDKFSKLPAEARPGVGQDTGKHGYTVHLPAATSPITVRVRAFTETGQPSCSGSSNRGSCSGNRSQSSNSNSTGNGIGSSSGGGGGVVAMAAS